MIKRNAELAAVGAPVTDGGAKATSLVRSRRRRARPVASADQSGPLQTLPGWVWLISSALALLGLLSKNPLLTPACVMALPVLAALLWCRGEPPVLFFSCAIQWLQVVTDVFYADFHGAQMDLMFGVPDMEKAAWLSLAGVVVLAIGMRLALKQKLGSSATQSEREVMRFSLPQMFIAWLISFVIASMAGIVAWVVPGLVQLIYSIISFKWVFFFILVYGSLIKRQGFGFLMVAVAIEFMTGLLGYFSGFKEVFFMLILVVFSVRRRLGARDRALLAAAATVILTCSLLWTAVKTDYRGFLNQGTGTQAATAPTGERLQKLWELLTGLNPEKINESIDVLIFRVSYVEYFARTIAYVPDVVPYENGKLWLEAIYHVIKPRFFFPDKKVTNDSARTELYTGVTVAGADQGTSIGIGYMGESYIDFGPRLMFLPIFLLGVLFGATYRFFVFNNRSRIVGIAIATAVLFPTLQAFGTSNTKILGGTITVCLTMVAFNFVGGAKVIDFLGGAQGEAGRPRRKIPVRKTTNAAAK